MRKTSDHTDESQPIMVAHPRSFWSGVSARIILVGLSVDQCDPRRRSFTMIPPSRHIAQRQTVAGTLPRTALFAKAPWSEDLLEEVAASAAPFWESALRARDRGWGQSSCGPSHFVEGRPLRPSSSLQWARFFEGGPSRQVLSQHRCLWKGVAIGRLLIEVSERKGS